VLDYFLVIVKIRLGLPAQVEETPGTQRLTTLQLARKAALQRVPGAMPALMGWTAATGHIDLAGLAVFGVLYIWQIPHTHAISIYREREYHAAGLKTLSGTFGPAVARRYILAFLVVQVAISLAPALLGVAGLPYLVAAIALGVMVLVRGFSGDGSTKWARNVFLTSIVYLPILFAVMVASGNA